MSSFQQGQRESLVSVASSPEKLADGTSFEDIFGSVTSHLKSAQSLLNKHKELTLKTRAQVTSLQEENLRLLAKLNGSEDSQVLEIGIQVDSLTLADEYPPLGSLQGETGGSVSMVLDDVGAVPTPPAPGPSQIAEPSGLPPSMTLAAPPVDRESLHSIEDAVTILTPTDHYYLGQPLPGSVRELSLISDSDCGCESTVPDEMPRKEPSLHAVVPTISEDTTPLSGSKRVTLATNKKLPIAAPDERSNRSSIRDSFTSWFDRKLSRESRDSTLSRDVAALPNKVFADAAAMKEKVRQAIGKPEYNVSDYYWSDGFFQWLASHPRFEQFTLLVISFNSLWIAYDADENSAAVLSQAKPEFQIAEHSFCIFFAFEIIVRFAAFRYKLNCLFDTWFMFDAFMVAVMVIEIWVLNFILTLATDSSGGDGFSQATSLKLLRLLRLTRMARIARLLRTMPELMILIKGMAVAMRSVLFTLCLLGIIIYLFSIFFRQLTDGSIAGQKYFASVPDAMLSLLLRGTLPDIADFVYDVSDDSPFYGIFLLVFILFASLTVMNMLVGVLCEVVTCVSSVEKEQLVVNFVQSQLSKFLINNMGRSLDDPMSKQEFIELLGRREAARTLHEVGVDVLGLMEISDFLFKEEKELTFPEFMELVLELRGSNTATVKHIVDLQRFVHMELRKTNLELENHFAAMLGKSEVASSATSKKTKTLDSIPFTDRMSPLSESGRGVIGIRSSSRPGGKVTPRGATSIMKKNMTAKVA